MDFLRLGEYACDEEVVEAVGRQTHGWAGKVLVVQPAKLDGACAAAPASLDSVVGDLLNVSLSGGGGGGNRRRSVVSVGGSAASGAARVADATVAAAVQRCAGAAEAAAAATAVADARAVLAHFASSADGGARVCLVSFTLRMGPGSGGGGGSLAPRLLGASCELTAFAGSPAATAALAANGRAARDVVDAALGRLGVAAETRTRHLWPCVAALRQLAAAAAAATANDDGCADGAEADEEGYETVCRLLGAGSCGTGIDTVNREMLRERSPVLQQVLYDTLLQWLAAQINRCLAGGGDGDGDGDDEDDTQHTCVLTVVEPPPPPPPDSEAAADSLHDALASVLQSQFAAAVFDKEVAEALADGVRCEKYVALAARRAAADPPPPPPPPPPPTAAQLFRLAAGPAAPLHEERLRASLRLWRSSNDVVAGLATPLEGVHRVLEAFAAASTCLYVRCLRSDTEATLREDVLAAGLPRVVRCLSVFLPVRMGVQAFEARYGARTADAMRAAPLPCGWHVGCTRVWMATTIVAALEQCFRDAVRLVALGAACAAAAVAGAAAAETLSEPCSAVADTSAAPSSIARVCGTRTPPITIIAAVVPPALCRNASASPEDVEGDEYLSSDEAATAAAAAEAEAEAENAVMAAAAAAAAEAPAQAQPQPRRRRTRSVVPGATAAEVLRNARLEFERQRAARKQAEAEAAAAAGKRKMRVAGSRRVAAAAAAPAPAPVSPQHPTSFAALAAEGWRRPRVPSIVALQEQRMLQRQLSQQRASPAVHAPRLL